VHDTAGAVSQAAGQQPALDRLEGFQRGMYSCFGRWRDTLYELTDALAGARRPLRSVAELMFEPACRRGWGSLYQALEHGVIDQAAARKLLVGQVEAPAAGQVPMFAIDSSKYPRPYARKVPDVGMQYAAEQDGYGGAPVVPGWSMQKVAYVGRLPQAGGADTPRLSWSQPVDVARIGTGDNANEIAAAQMAAVATCWHQRHPDTVPLFLYDIGYCPIYLTQQLGAGTQILVRLRSDRVFFGAPLPRQPGKVGRPVKHGARLALDEPATWGPPDAEHTHTAPDATSVYTQAWHDKHPEPRPRRKWTGTDVVAGTLIRREATSGDGHTRVWWLWWAGPAEAFDLPLLAGAYTHRFTIEHGFRFDKQDLFWTGHTPIDPDQAQRWSWLVALAYTQLQLARPLAADLRLPWEKPCTPDRLSPRRVRRVFRLVTAGLPTPARSPKPSRPGPGRPKGSKNKHPRPRRPVIRKGRSANTGYPKGKSPLAKIT
jgi:hypothetical protein